MKNAALALFVACVLVCCGSSGLCAAQPPAKPKAAADFTLKTLSGDTMSLHAFKGKQPVLLFFWTTWCPFCMKEFRMLNTVNADVARSGVKLLAINAGEPAADVSRVAERYKPDFPVLLDVNSEVTDAYGVIGVPTFVLVDKKGSVRSVTNELPRATIKQVGAE